MPYKSELYWYDVSVIFICCVLYFTSQIYGTETPVDTAQARAVWGLIKYGACSHLPNNKAFNTQGSCVMEGLAFVCLQSLTANFVW